MESIANDIIIIDRCNLSYGREEPKASSSLKTMLLIIYMA